VCRLDTSTAIQAEVAGRYSPALPNLLLDLLHAGTVDTDGLDAGTAAVGLGAGEGFADVGAATVWSCASKAAVLLGCLCRAPANALTRDLVFGSASGVPDALRLLDTCAVPATKAGAAWLLCSLVRGSAPLGLRLVVTHPEVMGLLVRAMQSPDMVVWEAAGWALQALVRRCPPAQEAALGLGLVRELWGAVTSGRREMVIIGMRVVDSLCRGCSGAQDAVRTFDDGALLRAIFRQLEAGDRVLAFEAVDALSSVLVDNPTNQSVFGEDRDGAGLASLVNLLHVALGQPGAPARVVVPPHAVRLRVAWAEKAVHALARVVWFHAGNTGRVAALGALRAVLLQDLVRVMQWVHVESFLDACCIVVAVLRVDSSPLARAQMGAVGMVQALVKVLVAAPASRVHPYTVMAAASVLGKLVGTGAGVHQGALDMVVSLGGHVAFGLVLVRGVAPGDAEATEVDAAIWQRSVVEWHPDMLGAATTHVPATFKVAVTRQVLAVLATLACSAHRASVVADLHACTGFVDALDTLCHPTTADLPTKTAAGEVRFLLD
jgi:hypothetical protein